MLNEAIFTKFIKEANKTYQIFCVWIYTNNQFAKYQETWNKEMITNENLKVGGRKYKNYFYVVIPSLQHAWFLSLSKLFDPSYHPTDTEKKKPRLSFYYILELLDDPIFKLSLQKRIQQKKYRKIVYSLKEVRNDFLAHNDLEFPTEKIGPCVDDLFKELNGIIEEIKLKNVHLYRCTNINLDFTEKLSQAGVDEIFSKLVL